MFDIGEHFNNKLCLNIDFINSSQNDIPRYRVSHADSQDISPAHQIVPHVVVPVAGVNS